ncbi:MAG TPA: hypothetical protein VF021_04215, partial [Longimicrobiales bacterium]
MRYITCTITLTEDTLTYHEEDERVFEKDVAFVRDRLAELTVQRLSYWIQNNLAQSQQKQLTSVKDLKAIGLHLHRLLFFDRSIREAFEKKHNELNERRRNEPDLRLRLELVFDTTTEALAALPWEFLYVSSKEDMDKGVFFAGERTELLLTRRLGTIKPEAFQPADELRILMVTCQPKVLGAIDSKEINGVVTSIEELKSV